MTACVPCQQLLTSASPAQPHQALMELKTIKMGAPEYVRNATWRRFMCTQCSEILKWQPEDEEDVSAGWTMTSAG